MTDRTEREGLRECPFCLKAVRLKPSGGEISFLVCDDGSCSGSGLFMGVVLAKKDSAIAAWNCRPTEALAGKGGGE